MKSFLKSLKRQDGFTLVELMVVVAIIGLLSAVAIPNFKKYQAKAKMSEAKLQLSAIYTAEASFFSDFNIYASCLSYMGFDPNPEANSRYFSVGFGAGSAISPLAHAAAVNSGLLAASCPAAFASTPAVVGTNPTVPNTNFFPANKGVGSARANATNFFPAAATTAVTALNIQGSTATMLYVVGAAGVIDGANMTNATSAALTMNQAKIITIVRTGY